MTTPSITSIKGNKKGQHQLRHHHHFVSGITRWINHIVFQGIPEAYPFSKKLTMLLNRSSVGKTWDWIIVITSLVASAWYVATQNRPTLTQHQRNDIDPSHLPSTPLTTPFPLFLLALNQVCCKYLYQSIMESGHDLQKC